MHSRKSVIRTATAALAISIGLAAFGGTALADPSYRTPGTWQHQAYQQHNWQNNGWQRHVWQHRRFYHHSRYHYGQYDHAWYHHDWSYRRDGNSGYHAPRARAYYAPSVLAFGINLPPPAGQYGH